jgi:hypothetical protein
LKCWEHVGVHFPDVMEALAPPKAKMRVVDDAGCDVETGKFLG